MLADLTDISASTQSMHILRPLTSQEYQYNSNSLNLFDNWSHIRNNDSTPYLAPLIIFREILEIQIRAHVNECIEYLDSIKRNMSMIIDGIIISQNLSYVYKSLN